MLRSISLFPNSLWFQVAIWFYIFLPNDLSMNHFLFFRLVLYGSILSNFSSTGYQSVAELLKWWACHLDWPDYFVKVVSLSHFLPVFGARISPFILSRPIFYLHYWKNSITNKDSWKLRIELTKFMRNLVKFLKTIIWNSQYSKIWYFKYLL